jgi:hypothetical protein
MDVEKSLAVRAYLLRCWQEGTAGQDIVWRYSLKEVLDERRQRGFASLEEIFDFLAAQLNEAAEPKL